MAGLMVIAGALPAEAHNRRTAFTGVFGPYDVVASVGDVDVDEGDQGDQPGVLLEVIVRTRDERRPVEDAVVRVMGDSGKVTVGPLATERYTSAYRAVLPGADVGRWDVEISIDGPPGEVTITEQIPGPRQLHGGGPLGGPLGGPSPSPGWMVAVAVAVVGLALAGFTARWRAAMVLAGGGLLAAGAVAVGGSWAEATEPVPQKMAALAPLVLAAGLLAAGLAVAGRRREDALVLVFTGSAGLAAVHGWVNRGVLTGAEVSTVLSPFLSRVTTAAALGLGGGLALLVLVVSRSKLAALVPGTGRHQPAGGVDPKA